MSDVIVHGSMLLATVCATRTEYAKCAACGVELQRTSSGDLADGVRAHYRTVHPERKIP